jgi:uncharacterized protein YkwD
VPFCRSGPGRKRVSVNGVRALRLCTVLAVLALTGLLAASALATSRSETNVQTLNRQVFAAINSFRAAHGLVRLRDSKALDRAARAHSVEMGKVGYFGHNSADGTAFWKRIQRYYSARNYSTWAAGENLLWAAPTISASSALNLWIASPGHLRNLLTKKWRQLGVSAVHVVNAPGVFNGQTVTIITTDFGVRRR